MMKVFNICLTITNILFAIMFFAKGDITTGGIYMLIANLYGQQVFKEE